jgi:hypothetical protein
VTVVLDSGAVTMLADQSKSRARALLAVLTVEDMWPPVVPSAVLVECLTGRPGRDAMTNKFLKSCDVDERLSRGIARRAAGLRREAGRGSAVDAIVVANAEPDGKVITADTADITALAAAADGVTVLAV